jgi:hypothetical protein
MDHHPVAVVVSKTRLRHDVADLEIADLGGPEARTVGDVNRAWFAGGSNS